MATHNVLITGGSRGIGLELARRFIGSGARVLVSGRSAARLSDAAREVPGLETAVSDIGDGGDRERLAAYALEVLPELDVVVNNAGIQRRVALAADDAPWSEREEELRILFSGPVHLNLLLIPHLRRRGRPTRIVNVTSGGAFVPQPFAPLYSAMKAALHSYTLNLRFALVGTNVSVTEIAPPAVATGLAGPGGGHGAKLAEFADAAYAGIIAGREYVGFGPTDSAEIASRLRAEREDFAALAPRFPVATYATSTDGAADRPRTAGGIEENKRVVRRYYAAVSGGRRDEATALLADDATWWIAGKPEQFALAGLRSLQEHQELLRERLAPALPHGVEIMITGMTAEGDRVAVEMENRARTADGRIYNNQFHMLFVVRDGKIHAAREYLDTQHAADLLLE